MRDIGGASRGTKPGRAARDKRGILAREEADETPQASDPSTLCALRRELLGLSPDPAVLLDRVPDHRSPRTGNPGTRCGHGCAVLGSRRATKHGGLLAVASSKGPGWLRGLPCQDGKHRCASGSSGALSRRNRRESNGLPPLRQPLVLQSRTPFCGVVQGQHAGHDGQGPARVGGPWTESQGLRGRRAPRVGIAVPGLTS